VTRVLADGASYDVRTDGSGPPLLLIHGFTGRGSNWAPLLPELRRVATTITVDLLGHGNSDSPADPARHAVERQAADVAAMLRRLRHTPATVMGYSMGARVALRLAITAPQLVARLILESPSAGMADPAERAARRASDEELARLAERDGIEAFVARWESLPIFASEQSLPPEIRAQHHAQRLRCRPDGLAASLRGAGQGSMESLHGRLGFVTAPALVIAGGLDAAGASRARQIAAAIRDAELAVVSGAGHAPHREQPAQVTRLVLDFLARPPAPPARSAIPPAIVAETPTAHPGSPARPASAERSRR
jgi:2-succinyl-6-hydroxy-2,4-cyclohexadiene-1-carboxylate synthase